MHMEEHSDRSQAMEPPSHLQPDGTFRPDDPLYPPYNSYDWSYRDQDNFEAVWTPAGDTKATSWPTSTATAGSIS